MSSKVFIYVLSEDGSDEVKYVGQTVSPGTRLYAHLENDSTIASNKKRLWIDDVKSRNGNIAMHIIDECDQDESRQREQEWIDYYQSNGSDLTNSAKAFSQTPKAQRRSSEPVVIDGNHYAIASRMFQRDVGRWMEEVLERPIVITKHGRPAVALVSYEILQEWHKFKNREPDEEMVLLSKIYELVLWVARKLGYSE